MVCGLDLICSVIIPSASLGILSVFYEYFLCTFNSEVDFSIFCCFIYLFLHLFVQNVGVLAAGETFCHVSEGTSSVVGEEDR